jgi:predicted DNA-binding transcriptional regulator YafY
MQEVVIDYTNWKGVRGTRTIEPLRMYWGRTNYHPESQWLLNAYDPVKKEVRIFAMKDIHSWAPV